MGMVEIFKTIFVFLIAFNPFVVCGGLNHEYGIMNFEEIQGIGEVVQVEDKPKKVEVFNTSSEKVVGSVSEKAPENSKVLVVCPDVPEKCYPMGTPIPTLVPTPLPTLTA